MFNRRHNIFLLAGFCIFFARLPGLLPAQTVAVPEPLENIAPHAKTEPEVQPGPKEGSEPVFSYTDVLKAPRSAINQLHSTTAIGNLEPKMGGAQLDLPPNLLPLGFKYNLPFGSTRSPTNAPIRLGSFFYLDPLSLSSSFLYSDNVDRSEVNRKDGWINIEELDVLGYIRLTDRLNLAFKVGLVYLPLQNKIGLAGFTENRFAADSTFYPLVSKLSYDLEFGEWNVHLYDRLRLLPQAQLFGDQFNFTGGNSFDEEDRTGRYAFRSGLNPPGGNTGFRVNQTDRNQTDSFAELVNTVGGSVDRLLPTVTRFEAGASHSDYFYYGDRNSENLPSSRDAGHVSLISERESLRFKPFITYQISRNDSEEWSHSVRGGVSGPITENLVFIGSAGYHWDGPTGAERMLSYIRLRHTIGPYTFQEVHYRRDLTYPEEDLENSYTYRIHQTLGPYVSTDVYAQYATFEDLNNNNTGTEEWRTGLHFTIIPSSKTTFRVGGIFSRVTYDNRANGRADQWTAVGQVRRMLSDSLETVFTYQYRDRNSEQINDSYYENLFVLTLTYYFGERHVQSATKGDQPYDKSALEGGGWR